MTDTFTDEDLRKGSESLTLGPAYFAARRTAERFMADFEAEFFKPLVDDFTKRFADELWGKISEWLLMDTENNLQHKLWHHTDEMVRHVLSGEEWAMKKFVLGDRYDCEKIRATVAKHIPKELQDARIADLEAKLEQAKKDIAWLRRSE